MARNILALLGGAILLVVGLMFSIVVIAVAAALLLTVWGYLWWKTRPIRKAMQEGACGGEVIDGEAVVVESYSVSSSSSPPGAPHATTPLPRNTDPGRG